MPDKFTTTTTTSYGSRITNSIKSVIAGLILFVGSFAVLYWNEGQVDYSTIAQTATHISAEATNTNAALNGQLVSATGIFDSQETIGDGLFLKPDKFIGADRVVEMYAWTEKEESKSKTNVGGSETTETTYTYEKEWTDDPENSSEFKYPEGHVNPQKTLKDSSDRAKTATLGVYSVDMASVELPDFESLELTTGNTTLSQGAVLASQDYLYIPKTKTSSFDIPEVGDLRVSYLVLRPGAKSTIFGKLDGTSITAYNDKDNNLFYRVFSGTREEAISTLHSEYLISLWLFRALGFVMMWLGLAMLFTPISVVLDVLPIFGTISRMLIGGIAFIVSLILSLVTILVSSVIHNVVALVITLVIAAVLIVMAALRLKKKKAAAIAVKPVV
ncbi:TMEM43 family protein [Candidatus Peregrinibacteria bacterium]|nr:TMEM43 family protein [Candidatus Peregrinibacteria bacterium]